MFSGVLGGFLSGLLGIGGGPIYVVFFSIFIHRLYGGVLAEYEELSLILANTAFAIMFGALFSVIKQYKMHNVYWRTSVTIAIPAAISSIVLSEILSSIKYNKTAFSIVFIITFLPLLYRMVNDNEHKKSFNHPYRIKVLYLNLTGLFSGIVTALSGLGGGFVIVPLLNSLFNIKIRKVVSISSTVIFLVAAALSLYNLIAKPGISANMPYTFGAINFMLVIPVVLGTMAGAPLGVIYSKKLSPRALQRIFLAVCIAIILHTSWNLAHQLHVF